MFTFKAFLAMSAGVNTQNVLLAGLFKHMMTVKMFHFQTASGFRHLKADEYLTQFLEQFDLFFELWQGETTKLNTKGFKIEVKTYTDEQFPAYLDEFVEWFTSLDDSKWPESAVSQRGDIVKSVKKLHYVMKEFR